ncbi:zinc finger CCHC domain-containing protein 24-like [Panulirus ornatus]|uniref:zinc finger CCHC domain-containing protein 24-like n=1 Tax=Panulirus ornatus TaxID=150431 RepID=UPI003A87E64C
MGGEIDGHGAGSRTLFGIRTMIMATVPQKTTKETKAPGKSSKVPAKQEKDQPQLTPYQGTRRTCGRFHCSKCKNEWFSANSWANSFQKCKGCNGKIYPYQQFPPWKGTGQKKNIPPHPQHLCQKCMQLGYFCGRMRVEEIEE